MMKTHSIYRRMLFFYILFCFIGGNTLNAQVPSSLTIYNQKNGLTQNSVLSLTFDSEGFLWVGTYRGVTRFNGHEFKRFFFDTAHKFYHSSNHVISLSNYIQTQNTFIKTKAGSVYKIENEQPLLYKKMQDSVFFYGNDLEQFPSLLLFNKFDRTNYELIKTDNWAKDKKQVISIDSNNFLVPNKNSTGIYYYKSGEKSNEIKINFPFLQFLKVGRAVFLLDSSNNFYYFNPIKQTLEKTYCFTNQKRLKSLVDFVFLWDTFNDESYCYLNNIFYSVHYNAVKNTIEFMPEFYGQESSKNFIWSSILHDKINGIYFVGTMNEGLCVFKKKWINLYSISLVKGERHDLYSTMYLASLKIGERAVIFPSGIMAFKKGDKFLQKKAGNFKSNIKTIAAYGKVGLLSADMNGVYYYLLADGYKKKHAYNESFNRLNKEKVQMLYPEGDSIWVSTNSSLYCITKKTTVLITKSKTTGTNSLFYGVSCIYRYSNKELWISGMTGNYRFVSNRVNKLEEIPELKNKLISSVTPYKKFLILSAYKEGLYVFDGKIFQKVPIHENNLNEITCNSTYIDSIKGFLWIIANTGLLKTNIQDLFVNDTLNKSPFFFYYGSSDGVNNTEFNLGGVPNSYSVLKNTEFILPATNGFVTVNSEKLLDSIRSTTLPIKNIYYNGENKINIPQDTIHLTSDISTISIELNVPHFGEPENLQLEYNYNDQGWKWIVNGLSQVFTLTNVTFGEHVLQVRKRIGFGSNDFQYRTLVVKKDKRYEEMWWFYPSLFMTLFLVIFLCARLYSHSINNKRKELQKLVDKQTKELSQSIEAKELLINIISHDMLTPLKYIGLIGGILEKGFEKDAGKTKSALGDIKNTANNLLMSSNSIINWMKYNSGRISVSKAIMNLSGIIDELFAYFEPLANEKNIVLKNQIPSTVFVKLDPNIFNIIINNLISNAIKYSEANEIKVSMEYAKNSNLIQVLITDNGKGISEELLSLINRTIKGDVKVLNSGEKNSSGLGFLLIGELAKVHNIKVNVNSSSGKGVVVMLEMY